MIVLLSTDPEEAVQSLSDKDVIRIPIEIAQVLICVWNDIKPGAFTHMIERSHDVPWINWVKESQDNYNELWGYGMDIVDEHYHRFGSRVNFPYKHSMSKLLDKLGVLPPLPGIGLTPMPVSIDGCREGYLGKDPFDTYTHRDKPTWM